jgi:hypothetical protein
MACALAGLAGKPVLMPFRALFQWHILPVAA